MLSLDQYSKEQLQEMSLIEVAYVLLKETKQPYSFKDLMAELTRLLNLDKAEADEKMVQFYTDINLDGRFLGLGDNRWGLRVWYPVDQAEEDTITPVKPRKKKAKKAVEDDDLEDFDEIEEEELEYDDLDDFDDDDDDLIEDDDLDDDLDEDDDDLIEDNDLIDDEEEELELDEEELEDEDEVDDDLEEDR
ncbi:DNA-directed RNA polymerase subunit delta [Mesobacillus foraminis]|uniref:Probable DNA-directed RNA polymerase subunit delta n=1 Tax=Mesobacillus foraminis TaxID=279826 RepID=A0A4R2BC22_9BACI|nr:DNA-directed RNA polymerase subunit delta [Mesobacillus foraminis]